MPLSLTCASALLDIELQGAVVTKLDIGGQQLLHPARGDVRKDPTLGACFPMLPWCNRLSRSGIATRIGMMPQAANWARTHFPVHGHGWQEIWSIAERGQGYVHLRSCRREPDGYSYIADLTVTLDQNEVTFVLSVTNTGKQVLPFGLGLHPYFSRPHTTLLTVPAERTIPMGENGLPVPETAIDGSVDFRVPKPVGAGALSVFYPATTAATVTTGARVIDLTCGGALRHLLLWAPQNQPFFCIEPMSHCVDDFSCRNTAISHDLEPDETISGWLSLKATHF